MRRFFLLFFLFATVCFANDEKKVLVLHSYHPSYKWTADIQKGINSTLKQSNQKIKLYIEYMDTKRHVDKKHYELLVKLFEKKYKNIKFDVIISSDNNAFNFLKRYNKRLFQNSPVIFSGLNYLKKDDIKGFDNFKGINEKTDLKKSYELIKKLHPNVKNIYTIIDTTTTGKKIKEEVLYLLKTYKNEDIKYEIINGYEYKEFLKKIKSIPKNSVILLSVYFRTADNKLFEYYEISQLLAKLNVAPVYGLWDFYFENGIIGGYLASGLLQGETAASMALNILNGVPIQNIKTIYESPNRYMFDYKHMKKHNIKLEQLPPNSYIINKPESFYELYKKEILTLAVIFLFMLILIILLLINIKRRIKAEKSIKKQLKFQQTLIDTVQTPIYYKNLKGEYLGCNNAFEELNQVNKKDIIGKTIYDVFPVEVAEENNKKDKKLLQNGGSQKYELSRLSNDNKKEYLIFTKTVFYNEEGKINGLVGSIFDITQLKLTSKKLNDLNKNLEKKVKERTKELEESIKNLQNTQDKLVEAEKMASLGGLVAGVAHEINTPLGISLTATSHLDTIAANLQSLYNKEQMSAEEFEEFLKQSKELTTLIIKNLTRTSELVKSFKQISVDQTSEEKRSFYLKSYLEDVILSLNSIIKKTQHKIILDIDERTQILSYPGAFSQIFTNLIINSFIHGFKYEKHGQIYIKADTKKQNLIINYTDNGVGIKEENLHKIFDPFFTTNREYGGTGLGLNIIYNIITRLLKGSITCKSKENQGIEFKITIPLNLH